MRRFSISTSALLLLSLSLHPLPTQAQINFTEHGVTDTIFRAYCVDEADLDGDGDIDIVVAANFDCNTIAWFENDGNQNFTDHILTDQFYTACDVQIVDIDSDDDLDILGASGEYSNRITWWENRGAEGFTEHDVVVNYLGATSAYAVDFDGDDDMDILASSWDYNRISLFENDGSQSYTEYIICDTLDGASHVRSADLDDDGDMDIMASGNEDGRFVWWENLGPNTFASHILTSLSGMNYPVIIFPVDLDEDDDLDLLGSYTTFSTPGGVLWWEQVGERQFEPHPIPTTIRFPYGLDTADLDLDGDLDILVTDGWDGDIYWLENNGITLFSQNWIPDDACLPHDIDAVDLDFDGDMDFVTACYVAGYSIDILWYENDLISPVNDNRLPEITDFELLQNYPNPFNATTNIGFELFQPSAVRLDVFNLLGGHIETLVDESLSPGKHTIRFNARQLPSGLYLYRLQTNQTTYTRKMLLMK